MNQPIITSIRRVTHNIFHNIANSGVRKRAIVKFAKLNNLAYFGAVDQRHDEHRVVRGFTVSASHIDNHYCVGPISGYDVSLIDRSDAWQKSDGSAKYNNWLVMAFDLHTTQDTPHLLINSNNHDNEAFSTFFSIYPLLSKMKFGTYEEYSPDFINRFSVYALLTNSIKVEHLLPADSARVLGAHFWPYSAELADGVLYVYADDTKLSINTLSAMSQNGLWLANLIDEQIENT